MMPSFCAIESVSQRRRGRLIDQAQHFKAGHAARVFGGLPLRVVEVGGHGDHGLGDRRAEKALGIALELAQNISGNLRRRELILAELDAQHFARLHVVGKLEGKQLQLARARLQARGPSGA